MASKPKPKPQGEWAQRCGPRGELPNELVAVSKPRQREGVGSNQHTVPKKPETPPWTEKEAQAAGFPTNRVRTN
jgi:hypothetical protein